MEGMEAKVNLDRIEKEFQAGLINAENKEKDSTIQVVDADASLVVVNIPGVVVRFLCHWKSRLCIKILSKGFDQDDAEFIKDYLKVTPEEIELYKRVINSGVNEFTPDQYKEFLNKWLCNPMILSAELIIEFELQKILLLRKELKIREKNKKKAEVI